MDSKNLSAKNEIAPIKGLKVSQDIEAHKRACLFAAIFHTLSVLATIYCFRAGDLSDFSVSRLISFASTHSILFQANCLTLILATISLFYLLGSTYKLNDRLDDPRTLFFLALATIATTIDLMAFSNLMVPFHDLSHRILLEDAANRSILKMQGWIALDQATSQILILANALYALAGLGLNQTILNGLGLSSWIGRMSIIMWSGLLLVSVLTFLSFVPLAIVLFFWLIILFIVWTICLYVNIDWLSQKYDQDKHPGNKADQTNQN